MKEFLLIGIILILLFLVLIIWYKYRSQSDQIKQIVSAISDSIDHKSTNQVLLMSGEKTVQNLLIKVNQLIEVQKNLEVKQVKQDESNRKMLSNISHDLKTPLTVILGYSELILNESDKLEESSTEKLEKIQRKTKDVLEMIEEFFDVMKLEAGELPMNMETIDLCEICREEILNYYNLIEKEKINVEVEIPDYPIKIEGDVLAIKRAISNLVDNAIRYGCAGRYLKICVYERKGHKFIDITDHGKGIVEDSQDKIFERLFTLEDSRNKKYQGSGLGLTITKRLIESMNGTLEVKSFPYQETTFTICF